MTVREAVEHAHTGDVWLFRGPTTADKAIRLLTNSPVNHVAMVVALDDLPPLLWHTELGQSLPSVTFPSASVSSATGPDSRSFRP